MKIGLLTLSDNNAVLGESNKLLNSIPMILYKNGFDVVVNTTSKINYEVGFSLLKSVYDIVDCTIVICDEDFEKCYKAKEIICKMLNSKLEQNAFALKNLEDYSKNQNVPLKNEDYSYAKVPFGSRSIKNPLGAFQGFLIEKDNKIIFFLPINIEELEHLFFNSVLPYILKISSSSNKIYAFKTYGIKQNELSLILKDYIKNKHNIDVIYFEYLLNGEVIVKIPDALRSDVVENFIKNLYSRIAPYVYADGNENIIEMISSLLKLTRRSIVFAEDFTSGNLVKNFCEKSKDKNILTKSYILKDNESKIEILGVDERNFHKLDIDYEEIAYQMVVGALQISKAEIAVSSVGNLSNGDLFFAIGSSDGVHIYSEKVFGDREQKIQMATNCIFFRLIKKLKQNDFDVKQDTI